MRLSTVFELLLIFLFIAFAASRTVDKHHRHHQKHGNLKSRQQEGGTKPASPNRYCQCTNLMCNCCRDFSLPVVSLKGPGCANVQYMTGDSMRLTMSFGDRILRNITLSGKRPRPVCMGLPAVETKFCGRIYGIQRTGDHFKACLALELRSFDDIEAALRVSCFRFGNDGVKLEPGRPVPVDTDDYDEDDDDDDYGFDEDDDDDDDDDFLSDDEEEDEDNDVDSGDYTGFSVLGDEFLDGFFDSSSSTKKKKKPHQPTTSSPSVKPTKKPSLITNPSTTTTDIQKNITTEASIVMDTENPNKSSNGTDTTTPAGEMSVGDASPSIITSTEFSVKVVQDGVTLDEIKNDNITVTSQNGTSQVEPTKVTMSVPSTTAPTKTQLSEKEEDEDDEEGDDEEEEEHEEEEEEEDEEGSTSGPIIDPKPIGQVPLTKDDNENILDGVLADDDTHSEDTGKNEESVAGEDEFRQLRSHVPRGPYQPMTLEDQERQFPGLSALIKPPALTYMTLEEQERRFPGLVSLIRPPSALPHPVEIPFDFPPVRSARTHRRMRLPPV